MISRSGDSIWAHGANGRGSDASAFSWKDETARLRREWELRRQDNETLDKQWGMTPSEPTDQTDIGQLLDREYARHQRRNRGWSPPLFDPSPVDASLPRDEWDERVKGFLKNPVRPAGPDIARDPHALAGQDAVLGVRSALVKSLEGEITNKGVADRIKEHYGMGRPRA